ncbi:MAG: glycosyltransferase [Alphaproteobacteria bacterium]|nr:glycosyltransferase [Alphaproteobacteria bacterium]
MKVAIIHYWLIGMRGGEKVVEALCRMFPEADIFTHIYSPDKVSDVIRGHRVTTSFVSSLPRAKRNYQSYLPLMPLALEQLDLRGYDLIISSESGPAKGIVAPVDALHVCYCHSPMRYIWNMFHEYRERSGGFTKLVMPPLSHYIRTWDAVSSDRVHHFVANSQNVSRRLRAYYRRDADVIYPPVETSAFQIARPNELQDFYLMAGELVAYKRPDLAIEAFNRTGRRLVVVGGGEMLAELRAMAEPNVVLLGSQPFSVLRQLYSQCRGLIFPGEEDFGIVPVEAMSSGRPVVAFGKGGALETVVDGLTGVFFKEQTVDSMIDAIERLEQMDLAPARIAEHARQFDTEVFMRQMKSLLQEKLTEAGHSPSLLSAQFGERESCAPIPITRREGHLGVVV